MDVSDSSLAAFPKCEEFGKDEPRKEYTKAIPFGDFQQQKVYKIVGFKCVKVGTKEAVILNLLDADQNGLNYWATSCIQEEFNEKKDD